MLGQASVRFFAAAPPFMRNRRISVSFKQFQSFLISFNQFDSVKNTGSY